VDGGLTSLNRGADNRIYKYLNLSNRDFSSDYLEGFYTYSIAIFSFQQFRLKLIGKHRFSNN
jgi:hypothetical protein